MKVTLKPGAPLDDSYVEPFGLERVKASKRNFFSCMDSYEQEWEFYPLKFKSKINS